MKGFNNDFIHVSLVIRYLLNDFVWLDDVVVNWSLAIVYSSQFVVCTAIIHSVINYITSTFKITLFIYQ